MQKRFPAGIAVVIAIGLMLAFASSALGLPSYGVCSGCHSLSSAVIVKATQTSNNGTTANYSVTVSGPNAGNGWAVYDGSTRLAYATAASGTFAVADGKTYTVYGGNANGNQQLYNKVTISPASPTPPPAPSPGTSGTPGATGTPDPTGTPVPAPGDTVTYRVHFNVHHHNYKGLKAVLKNANDGTQYTAAINRNGNAVFHVPAGTYRLSVTGNSHFKVKARTVYIGVRSDNRDD
jgi:hypothetical protein